MNPKRYLRNVTPVETTLTGLPTSPGIAIGEVYLYRHDAPTFREFPILDKHIEREINRFDDAHQATIIQLQHLCDQLAVQVGDAVARIFEAQNAILEDGDYSGDIRDSIRQNKMNAEASVNRITEKWWDKLSSLEGELFRQRAHDVRDVGLRIIKNLLGASDFAMELPRRTSILVSDDLLPSDVVHLLEDKVQAVATDLGGTTSHTAILTRALEVPAVVGLKKLTRMIRNGDKLIVNGNSGKVIVNPSENTVSTYNIKRSKYLEYISSLSGLEKLPAETLDGRRIALRANLELPQEIKSVLVHGCEGVGLFRSEYLFLARHRLPDEEDQLKDYRTIIETLKPQPVTIRTFDLGGDKVFPDLPHPVEANPFMGWRAIRVSLDQPMLFHTQLRAILRAATSGSTRIMFPFISGVKEILEVKSHIEQVKEELAKDRKEFNPNVEIGIMIELPSAVLMADRLAQEVDFFSIGTNDLTQFTLAVDRGNERVRTRYSPLHPAMIRMIKMTVNAGHSAGIEVAMCGELAANPLATMLLIGLGLDELSVSPVAVPEVKKIIRAMKYSEAVNFTRRAMEFNTAPELTEFCFDKMRRRFADLPIWFNDEEI